MSQVSYFRREDIQASITMREKHKHQTSSVQSRPCATSAVEILCLTRLSQGFHFSEKTLQQASSHGDILGMKDKWFDDESAETWAEQMNWDLQVKIQNCEYLLSRKKTV